MNGENGSTFYVASDFYSFGAKRIPKAIKKFIDNTNIITDIYRIQAYDLIMCRYFCIGFIDFMVKGRNFLDYANLFPSKKKR